VGDRSRRGATLESVEGAFPPRPGTREVNPVSEPVYKKIELTGSSADSIEAAIDNALARASKTVRNMRWFEVIEIRGNIDEETTKHYQVTIKVGFHLED
jgi:flavin-binding protein dodecin